MAAARMTLPKVQPVWSLLLLAALAGCRSTPLAAGPHLDPLSFLSWGQRDKEAAWGNWAATHLQSGDLVFVRGESRILFGLVNFSQLCTEVADSRFSHIGLVSRENDAFYVYDVVMGGPRRVPFGKFATDRQISLMAVKRLQPEYRRYAPAAIKYCRQVSARHGKFDTELKLDNEYYYCSEMIELAFRHAGLPLSAPVRIDQLPHIDRLPVPVEAFMRTVTTIDPQQEIYLPGNEQIGIWACPYLDLILDATTMSQLAADLNTPSAVATDSGIARSSVAAGSVRTVSADQNSASQVVLTRHRDHRSQRPVGDHGRGRDGHHGRDRWCRGRRQPHLGGRARRVHHRGDARRWRRDRQRRDTLIRTQRIRVDREDHQRC